jgi:hypothetical protein
MKAKNSQTGSEVSAKRLWAMKREAQARDRERVAKGAVLPEAMLLLRPDQLRGARIEWPKGSLLDEEAQPCHSERPMDVSVLRSREMHRIIARRLQLEPALREALLKRVEVLREANVHGRVYHDQWHVLLSGPLEDLLCVLTEVSERADALRHESPCGVLITEQDRVGIFRLFP